MGSLQACVLNLKELLNANHIFLIGDDSESLNKIMADLECSAVVVTSENELQKLQQDGAYKAYKNINKNLNVLLYQTVLDGIDGLKKIKDMMLAAYSSGFIKKDDKVLCVVYSRNKLISITLFDVKESVVGALIDEVKDRVNYSVFESTLTLASELAKEGRESGPLGALFVLGSSDDVIDHSKPLIIDPFYGHDSEKINVLYPQNWETVKAFSQLDGAFIIEGDGIIRTSGRYISVDSNENINLPSGLGGRHLAAASVTKLTKAIAITVSVSGIVRVFKDGEIIYHTEPIRRC